MRIQAFTPLIFNNKLQDKKQQNNRTVENRAYNPIAYNDLTFTSRVCWTPEEFYSLPFNKNGMPETMKQYINADFEYNQHLRPQDVMALVFEDIKQAKDLQQVKRLFPDEPLFKNLTDKPNKKAISGILAEIDLMREDGKTLFKNGKDNLGLYILEKIYVEGKTLKEINEDFKKDVSVHYAGLSEITYDTKNAFGIKFPNKSFWKSFTHNRDNFKYTYKPRKPSENKPSNNTPKNSPVPQARPRFSSVKDWEIDSFSEALIKGNGSRSETIKRLKKSSVRDDASLGFVAKYMGEINSVVLEKLHISPEMSDFFENYDGLSKSQKQRLDDYWKNTDTRELRSTIMKDVIKLFFEAYGVDGQNDEFKELIEYAHSIKPARIEQQKEHNRIQTEYDEMANRLEAEEKTRIQNQLEEVGFDENSLNEFDELLEKAKAGLDVNCYKFKTENGDNIVIAANLKEALAEGLNKELAIVPKNLLNKFIKFMTTNEKVTDKYILSRLIHSNGFNIPDTDKFMPFEQMNEITNELNDEFFKHNQTECRALAQALVNVFAAYEYPPKACAAMMSSNPFYILTLINNTQDYDLIFNQNNFKKINSDFNKYKQPLNQAEAIKIMSKLIGIWRNTTVETSPLLAKMNDSQISNIMLDITNKLKTGDKTFTNLTKKIINAYIQVYGGSLRLLLNNDIDPEIAKAKFEAFLTDLYIFDQSALTQLQMFAKF